MASNDNVQGPLQMTGLKPPENLMNLTAEGFSRWKQKFQIYRMASGANRMSGEVQVALLLHSIGDACIDVYNTLSLTEEEKRNYDIVIQKLEDYFVPVKNESVNSHVFFTRNQHAGETFDAYITSLKKLSIDCNFGELKDRLIRDRIIAGIIDKRLKDRLLRESDLTLQKTIQICKAAELANQQLKQFETTVTAEVAVVRDGEKKQSQAEQDAKQNRKKYKEAAGSATKARTEEQQCSRCGFKHKYGNCPAYNKYCNSCGKLGHFIKMCKSKKAIKSVSTRSSSDEEVEDEYEEIFLDCVNINTVDAKSDWIQNLKLVDYKNRQVVFKIDTGAQCNIITSKICDKIGIKQIEKSKVRLSSYTGEKNSNKRKSNIKL